MVAATRDRSKTRDAELEEMEAEVQGDPAHASTISSVNSHVRSPRPPTRARSKRRLQARFDELGEPCFELEAQARASGRGGARPAPPGSALCSGRAGSQARRRARPGRGACHKARDVDPSTAERLSGGEDQLASLRAYVEEGGTAWRQK